MRSIATVGVYQSSLDDFLDKLRRNRVSMVVDVRQRRGVRGREDHRLKVGKRSRVELAEAYRHGYFYEVLDQVDLGAFLESLPDDATSALLCVERDARACHRSLIAARLRARYGVAVVNL